MATERINMNTLNNLVRDLNFVSGVSEETYVQGVNTDGNPHAIRANVGNYHVASLDGVIRLYRITDERGGAEELASTNFTREMYHYLNGMIAGVRSSKRDVSSPVEMIIEAIKALGTLSLTSQQVLAGKLHEMSSDFKLDAITRRNASTFKSVVGP